jgi:SAM-dependent methyltransferase
MDLKETEILGDSIGLHWYYKSKANAMMQLLSDYYPSVILDVGAGSGFFTKKILSDTLANEGWCVDISYDKNADKLENGNSIKYRKSIDAVNADLVLLMDVLEHVDDDIGLLRQYIDKVPAGAYFLISVPAFNFLWSGHDVFLGHKRRYNLKQIEEVVTASGLEILHGSYYFALVLPIAILLRMIRNIVSGDQYKAKSQLSKHSSVINKFLSLLSAFEVPFFKINRFAGLTIFVVAKKN